MTTNVSTTDRIIRLIIAPRHWSAPSPSAWAASSGFS
ncbi:DUF2892 domain-containing protein [Cellulomonas sp. KRMCY2]|nr:DUF2892 domain-containing protein [Cellulomonas sp. KRMCY2]